VIPSDAGSVLARGFIDILTGTGDPRTGSLRIAQAD
jgi:hypothetical protein